MSAGKWGIPKWSDKNGGSFLKFVCDDGLRDLTICIKVLFMVMLLKISD